MSATKLFPRYKDDNLLLGQGAFAKVKLFTDSESGEKVAAKEMSHSNNEALVMERDILKKISYKDRGHVNIVKLLGTVREHSYTYFILEHLSGGQLYNTIVHQHYYTEASVANYIKQILSGINYCHQYDIVHADIKPENILFAVDGNDKLKIVDFGVSFYDGVRPEIHKFGTYKAPEMVNRNLTFGKPIDIWACGLILFTLLCGEPAFTEDDKNDQLQFFERAKTYINFVHSTRDDFGEAAKDLIRQMLCVDAGQRITAEEALKHSWITDVNLPKEPLEKTMKNLQGFNARRKLK